MLDALTAALCVALHGDFVCEMRRKEIARNEKLEHNKLEGKHWIRFLCILNGKLDLEREFDQIRIRSADCGDCVLWYLPLTNRPTAKSVCIVRWNRFVLWAVSHFRRTHCCRCRSQICKRHSDSARPCYVWDNVIANTTSIRPSPNADTLDRRISQLCPVWRVQRSHTKSYPHSVWHYANAPCNAPCGTIEQIKTISWN